MNRLVIVPTSSWNIENNLTKNTLFKWEKQAVHFIWEAFVRFIIINVIRILINMNLDRNKTSVRDENSCRIHFSILKMNFMMKVKQMRWYFLSYDFNSLLDLQNVYNNVCHIINVFVLQIDLFWVQFQFFLTAWDMKITLLLGYFKSHIDFRRKVWCLSFNLFIFMVLSSWFVIIMALTFDYTLNIW